MEISNNMNNTGSLYKINEPGVQKPRGQKNAEIQHNKQQVRQGEVAKTQVPKDVVKISEGTGEMQKSVNNGPPEDYANQPYSGEPIYSDTPALSSEGTPGINATSGPRYGVDSVMKGAQAEYSHDTIQLRDEGTYTEWVKLMPNVDVDKGNDTYKIGNGAKTQINAYVIEDDPLSLISGVDIHI